MSNTTDKQITYTETADAVTVTITGAALGNLRKMATALNSLEWCDNDNTPASVLDNFIIGYGLLNKLCEDTRWYGNSRAGGAGDIAVDLIVSLIDTGYDDNTPEDKARKRELLEALEAAGI